MNGKTGARIAGLATVALLTTTACGVVHVSFGGSTSQRSATHQASLAFAHCMRTHGLPAFPDPRPSQGFSLGSRPAGNSPEARAYNACEYLLAPGSSAATQGP